MTVDQATLRLAGRSEIRREPNEEQPVLSERAVTLGYRYRSATIMSEGHDGGIAADPRSRKGEPGTRAAHVVLQRNGTAIFALDLFGRRPVLIAGSAASGAAAAAAGRIALRQIATGRTPTWAIRLGGCWTPMGSHLMVPCWCGRDGFVAWRTRRPAADIAAGLEVAMQVLMGGRTASDNRH